MASFRYLRDNVTGEKKATGTNKHVMCRLTFFLLLIPHKWRCTFFFHFAARKVAEVGTCASGDSFPVRFFLLPLCEPKSRPMNGVLRRVFFYYFYSPPYVPVDIYQLLVKPLSRHPSSSRRPKNLTRLENCEQ